MRMRIKFRANFLSRIYMHATIDLQLTGVLPWLNRSIDLHTVGSSRSSPNAKAKIEVFNWRILPHHVIAEGVAFHGTCKFPYHDNIDFELEEEQTAS